jgi:hypothetical protein
MIENYIRPATFPVGIKMLARSLPQRLAPRCMGSRFATCQTINIVRRYSWSIDYQQTTIPVLGLVALGFKPNVVSARRPCLKVLCRRH